MVETPPKRAIRFGIFTQKVLSLIHLGVNLKFTVAVPRPRPVPQVSQVFFQNRPCGGFFLFEKVFHFSKIIFLSMGVPSLSQVF